MLRQLPWICILMLSVSASVPYVVNPDFVQCSQPQCDAIDEILVKSVEVNAEPCQDFVNYACGKNISKEMYYGTGARYMSEPVERLADLRRLLDGTTFVEENIESFKKEKQIFQKCQRDAFGEQEMHRYKLYLEQYGADQLDPDSLPKSIRRNNKENAWTMVDLKYALDGFGSAFFDVDIVEREKYNEIKRYIQISPTSDNVLDTHDLLISKYVNPPSRNSFHRGQSPGTKYIDLKNFISEFNKIIPYEKYDDFDKENDNIISLGDWATKYSGYAYNDVAKYDWVLFMKRLFEKVTVIDNTTQIILKDESYFKKLTELFSQQPQPGTIVLENYIHLRFVSKTIGFVDRNYQEKHSIIPQVKGLICTPGLLVGTAHIYMKTFFPKDNKEMVKDIFEFVQMNVAKYLGSDEYNPYANLEATKTFLRQLNSAKTIIGYDKWLEDENYVSNFYDTFPAVVADKYIENQMHAVKVLKDKKLKAYTKFENPLFDMKVFLKSFTQENIEFSSNLKQILFPARAFSEDNYKFLSAQIPNAINYGATGVAIASKIFELWLKKTNHLQNATQCISSQVNHRIEQVNTHDFLIKATAYLLGLRVAYESWPNKDSYPIQFPQFGALTDDRLFFLSFAEVMCKTDVSKDEIHPRNFVNLAVSNMEEFSEAFQCYETHRMNRQRKCDPLRYSANTDDNSYL